MTHPNMLTFRANLAHVSWSAERTDETIGLGKRVLADSDWLLGRDDRKRERWRSALAAWRDEVRP